MKFALILKPADSNEKHERIPGGDTTRQLMIELLMRILKSCVSHITVRYFVGI